MELITAEKARNLCNDLHEEQTCDMIFNAAKEGKTKVFLPFNIPDSFKERLKRMGYIVNNNEANCSIVWGINDTF